MDEWTVAIDWEDEHLVSRGLDGAEWRTPFSADDSENLRQRLCLRRANGARIDIDAARVLLGKALLGEWTGDLPRRIRYVLEDRRLFAVPFEAALLALDGEHIDLLRRRTRFLQSTRVMQPGTPSLRPHVSVAFISTPLPPGDPNELDADTVTVSLLEGLTTLQTRAPAGASWQTFARPTETDGEDVTVVLAHGCLSPRTQSSMVRMFNRERQLSMVNGRHLSESLRTGDRGHHVMMIAACHGAEGLGQDLLREGVTAIVCFRGEVLLTQAAEAIRIVWNALAAGRDLDDAAAEARYQLAAAERLSGELLALPLASVQLVVAHDFENVVPFARAVAEAQAGLMTRRLDSPLGVGPPVRLDAAAVLDRRPGAIVLVDWVKPDLLQLLVDQEHRVAAWGPVPARAWRDARADEPPPEGHGPLLVSMPPGIEPGAVVREWKDVAAGRRVVFRTLETHRVAEWRALCVELGGALLLERFNANVDFVLTELPTDPSVATPEIGSPRFAAAARSASRQLRGDLRLQWEPAFCSTDDGAEAWMRALAGLDPPDPKIGDLRWRGFPSAEASLVVGRYRAGLGRPCFSPSSPALCKFVNAMESGDLRLDKVLADARLTELVVRVGRGPRTWSELASSHAFTAGFHAVACSLAPDPIGVQVLLAAEGLRSLTGKSFWGWSA